MKVRSWKSLAWFALCCAVTGLVMDAAVRYLLGVPTTYYIVPALSGAIVGLLWKPLFV